MGGDVTVQSQFGKGTSFFISVVHEILIPKSDLNRFKINKFDN